MKSRTAGANGQMLLSFSLSYLLLLLIPLAMGIGAYMTTVDLSKKQMASVNQQLLKQSIAKAENGLAETNGFAQTFFNMSIFTDILNITLPLDAADLFTIHQVIQEMPSAVQNSLLIDRYLVYSPKSGLILEPRKGCVDIRRYYDTNYAYGSMTFEQWKSDILEADVTKVFVPMEAYTSATKSSRAILFLRNYLSGTRRHFAKLIFYIDEQKLLGLFAPVFENGARHLYIYDSGGVQLAGFSQDGTVPPVIDGVALEGGEHDIEGQRMVILCHRSDTLGWRFVVATPTSVFYMQASRMLFPIFAGMGLLLVVGILLTLLLMHYNRKPLLQIVKELPAGESAQAGQRGLWGISAAISRLASNQRILTEKIGAQRMYLQSALINQLVRDESLVGKDIQALLAQVDIHISGEGFRGIYLVTRDAGPARDAHQETGDLQRTAILELLAGYALTLKFLALKDVNQYILLYCREGGDECLLDVLHEVYNKLRSRCGIHAVFYVGHECRKLCHVSASFATAQHLMNSFPESDSRFLFVDDHACSHSLDAAYTQHDEQTLIRYAKTGRMEDVAALLEELRQRNFENTPSDPFFRQLLCYRMLYTLMLACDSTPLPAELQLAPGSLSTDHFFALLAQQYEGVCDNALEKRRKASGELIESVMEYIVEYQTDACLSLSRIALRFGLTENYLSSFIKEKAGVNFSAYLEQLRIQHADALLNGSADTVERIALAVGYTNVKSFRRAYVRLKGYTPTEHRKRQITDGRTPTPTT